MVIAPQWIGDAVMTEPLLRRLHARGERITVGALPWVAPVYRAMPQVGEVIEGTRYWYRFQSGFGDVTSPAIELDVRVE